MAAPGAREVAGLGRHDMPMNRILSAALAFVSMACIAGAAPPTIDSVSPAGAQRGSTVEVTAAGKIEPWPASAWCSNPAVSLAPVMERPGVFTATVAGDAAPGPCWVRVFNAEGCSDPVPFVVGEAPDLAEAEPNGSLDQAMPVDATAVPLTINGKLDPGGDVDSFAFDLGEGAVLTAAVDAYALGSPIDPLLHIRDARGTRLAFNHDATLVGLDPVLTFTAPSAGRYTLRLFGFTYPPTSSHRIGGSSKCAYRLRLSASPPDRPELSGEREEQTLPFAVVGAIDALGDADAYSFEASAGTTLSLRVRAGEIGSPLDPSLRIADAGGKAVASADDIDPKRDPDVALEWKVPADGRYTATVADTTGKFGDGYFYRFEVGPVAPGFIAKCEGHKVTVAAGGEAELSVQVERQGGHDAPLQVTASGLPEGVAVEPVAVDGEGRAAVTVRAAAGVAGWSGPISLRAGEVLVSVPLKDDSTDEGDLLLNAIDSVWLTVVP